MNILGYLYLDVEENEKNKNIIYFFKNYADQYKKYLYIIDRPLVDKKYVYDYKDKLVVLMQDHKILLINCDDNDEKFNEFAEDFIEDLGSIADKFSYKKIIGRPKSWKEKNIILNKKASDIDMKLIDDIKLPESDKRTVELLISLLIGSINDIDRIKTAQVPENLLDKIKQKIILFDTEQTSFIYKFLNNKTVKIQGLSGTGKTELLLHKLKELYTSSNDAKIAFTCHNEILANNMRKRIPDFFNFMKVEEQIKWKERLWCIRGWGNKNNKDSGIYRLICDFYEINFYTLYSKSFDNACATAIDEIKLKIGSPENKDFKYLFNYMLIDESQDFPGKFFELCEMVTENTIYIAGDIFQNIFHEETIDKNFKPDFLLNKCYRTDPRTLMFAHGLGMGLFEKTKLNWLNDDGWEACGYIIEKKENDKIYNLKREPVKRFEDLNGQNVLNSVDIIGVLGVDYISSKIIDILAEIKKDNPSLCPEDIAIIFMDDEKYIYPVADMLRYEIKNKFKYEVNIAYESKEKITNSIFVSNKNNVKGLEFPFIICITKTILQNMGYRNSLYMALTRSFIKSYLFVLEDNNITINNIKDGLKKINTDFCMEVNVPTEEELRVIKHNIEINKEQNKSYAEFIEGIFNELQIKKEFRKQLKDMLEVAYPNSFETEFVKKFIQTNNELIKEKININLNHR